MRGWARTILYYAAAFWGGAIVWGVTFYLYHRATVEPGTAEAGDPYYAIVSAAPILLNALPQCVAAWILRRVARRFACRAGWQWLAAGTVISMIVVAAFGQAGLAIERAYFSADWQSTKTFLLIILLGPMILTAKPWWLPVIAVAATSWLLWLAETGGKRSKGL
jgi:hypothetical protein